MKGVYVVAVLYVCAAAASVEAREVIRDTQSGKIRGQTTNLAQVFYGIRFAAPPKRWQSPDPPVLHDGIYDAAKPGPMCYQRDCTNPNFCLNEISEDCLFLNIFAPLGAKPKTKRAVIVYIHGGAFDAFTGGASVLNGERIAELGNVIVVTINFRLGLFSTMVNSNTNSLVGNYGLMDQRQALMWVQNNIGYFGGNRKKVTLAGHGGGAISVAIHLTSGKANSLFSRAVFDSGFLSVPLPPLQIGISMSETVATFLECPVNNVKCLRGKSADDLLLAEADLISDIQANLFPDSFARIFIPLLPIIDGDEVPLDLISAFQNGSFTSKPIIIGSTLEEWRYFTYLSFPQAVDQFTFNAFAFLLNASNSSEIVQLYPSESPSDYRDAISQLGTDVVFTCPNRFLSKTMTANANPTYSYVLENGVSTTETFGDVNECVGRPCHTANTLYLFQSDSNTSLTFTAKEQALSDKIICHYSNFAKTMNVNKPNKCTGTYWPTFRTKRTNVLFLDENESVVRTGFRKKYCKFWREFGILCIMNKESHGPFQKAIYH